MGYNATFEGEFTVWPPLSEEERETLRDFAKTRHESADTPGYWCQWVPNDAGTVLTWDQGEKFYRSADWIRYLIETFLEPSGHLVSGTVTAVGQDGMTSQIIVTRNAVRTREVTGPAPAEYALLIEPRGADDALDREYDAAFDLEKYRFSPWRATSPELPSTVADFVAGYGSLALVQRDERTFVDAERGVTLELWRDGTMIVRLLADIAMTDAQQSFDRAIAFARALAEHLTWVVYDPAQRIALRPTARFRDQAIAVIEGYMMEESHFPRHSVV